MTTEEQLMERLKKLKRRLAVVESCTGGLVAHRITEISGASEIFWGGWVAYDNEAKSALGVPRSLIESHGAVSAEVAQALAEAGRRSSRVECCIATTGIAGPGGGTAAKPVGLCYVAVASLGSDGVDRTQVRRIQAPTHLSRSQNKSHFADEALRLALQVAENPSL